MYIKHGFLALFLALAALPQARAQTSPSAPGAPFQIAPPAPAAAPQRPAIELGPVVAASEQWENFFDQVIVRNVGRASLYPVMPAPERSNGAAVIVVPGGGYQFVSVDNEGFPVAERLAQEGYIAFVLKYRTMPTPPDPQGFLEETARLFANIGRSELHDYQPAVDDLTMALSYVQSHCADMGCDPNNINVIGFSAGARTLIRALEHSPQQNAIHSAALMYPPMTQVIIGGPRPPLFLGIAVDDPLFRQGGFALPQAWVAETGAIEFHLYSGGSHGFGTHERRFTSAQWLDQYVTWLGVVGAARSGPR